MLKLYGLKTCDTCRKALKALEAGGKPVEFIDVRKTPPSAELLAQWLDQVGDKLLNTKSTTWRGLDQVDRDRPVVELLAEQPTLIKRPVIEGAGKVTVGWTKEVQAIYLD
ncbi:Spx/MgsR family RNA polymerase-binding regulatory protein [Qingshengfaniella alkalisoli]|uniref:Spx/MgsR family RNA polymerase-binding regulatory protein n=2 Tax=Qingshengfaniella alkalisoli TaxID=2599296 RepID=A0A5B8J789_9RHOB|nr:Spx/MgsR family RNA polymerase-binding regulatory protein [Qingshengfaniella alkalisoli]